MNVFLRTFNRDINSKTGAPLPQGAPRRGTPEWLEFQDLMLSCLRELGCETFQQLENPTIPDNLGFMDSPECIGRPLRTIYVHQTKREKPDGDLFWMQMHERRLFTVDTNGWGADHSGLRECASYLEDTTQAKAFCEDLSDTWHSSGQSKHDQPTITDHTPERFILVPVQIPRDYTIANHSPITVRYFIESIIAWAAEAGYHICFKMHPHNRSDNDLIQAVNYGIEGSRYIHKVEGNIHELIKRSMGLFVINSGTGFEALVHGKPVATFGNCDYNRVTFNADIRRLDEARNFIYGWKPEDRLIAWQFVYWYYHRHAYCLGLPGTRERLLAYLRGVVS